jgi:hypothetical protein
MFMFLFFILVLYSYLAHSRLLYDGASNISPHSTTTIAMGRSAAHQQEKSAAGGIFGAFPLCFPSSRNKPIRHGRKAPEVSRHNAPVHEVSG